jgi:predicted RNA-binding protein with PUA-like domain
MQNYWLVKSEPSTYSWEMLLAEKETFWSGVRNYQARNNLRAMQAGDLVFFYHSVTNPAIVGIAKVSREAYQDPTTEDNKWSVVDIVPVETLAKPVSLQTIKSVASLENIGLIRQSRLSVMPISELEWHIIRDLSK